MESGTGCSCASRCCDNASKGHRRLQDYGVRSGVPLAIESKKKKHFVSPRVRDVAAKND